MFPNEGLEAAAEAGFASEAWLRWYSTFLLYARQMWQKIGLYALNVSLRQYYLAIIIFLMKDVERRI